MLSYKVVVIGNNVRLGLILHKLCCKGLYVFRKFPDDSRRILPRKHYHLHQFSLREECTDFYYSTSSQIVTFLSFIICEALREAFCFEVIQYSF